MKSILADILSPFPPSVISITNEEFLRCVELARIHGAEMLFYSRLRKHFVGLHAFIDDYLKLTERSYLFTVARSMRQEALEKDLLTALTKESIPACIIKGNEIARVIYEDPNCRGSADVDVLIKTTDLINADKILCENGFTRNDSLPLLFVIGRLHHISYYNAKNGCLLELHWDFGFPLYFNLTPDEIWKGMEGNETEGYSLRPGNMVIMLFTHHFRHGFREFKILVDILWCFYRYENIIDWREFAEKLKKYGLIKTTIIILDQLDALWYLSDGPLESYKILRGQLASIPIHTPKYLLRYFQMDIENKKRKALDMQMAKFVLDKKSKVLYSFVKIFFPRPQDIKALYPEAGNWMLPFNYLRFISRRLKQSAGLGKM